MPVDFSKGVLRGVASPPAPPPDSEWRFIEQLKEPLWAAGHGWQDRAPRSGEADLRGGIGLVPEFPDDDGVLATAYDDLAAFCAAGGVALNGKYAVVTRQCATEVFEAYRIEVEGRECRVMAADGEGIRRGIFALEEMMLAAGGPFLPLGVVARAPQIKSRVSRCFFGPIKRPPRFRDELTDDVDYYPDHYLNRLAHEGINGLWLTVSFRDLCPTTVIPEFGGDAERRLAKLRRTVEQCRRFGIGTYIFAIEPMALPESSPIFQRYPELRGVTSWMTGYHTFCPWSETAARYLYEATHHIFARVPHLAGLINISHGELPTNCQSSVTSTEERPSRCPRCAAHEPWQNINATLEPMARGMRDANPAAKLIAWFYMPSERAPATWVYELPKHCPEHVIMQFNFESGVTKRDFGRGRCGADYWISTPGPSAAFERLARVARQAGTAMAAKIQTGCSHEVATVPFVPTPGLLYRKFAAMHELGVEHVMLCWYFGNYPGVMNKAAGELSFTPLAASEADFVGRLVLSEWGRHAATVAAAYNLFAAAYSHYPLVTEFQYWGPMHDGVVWPLLLRPHDAPLAPTWQVGWYNGPCEGIPYPPSGDRIGEALGMEYTLAEAIECCGRLSRIWAQGVAKLRQVAEDGNLPMARRADIAVAQALGIQFSSGCNILRFYDLRERMVDEPAEAQLLILQELRQIALAEMANSEQLRGLCLQDSRLGFHSEAEAHKYFPAKLTWRMGLLRDLLEREIPALQREIEQGSDPFAAYAGRAPQGAVCQAHYLAQVADTAPDVGHLLPPQAQWQHINQPVAQQGNDASDFVWCVGYDRQALYLCFRAAAADSRIMLVVEPRRLWNCQYCVIDADGQRDQASTLEFDIQTTIAADGRQGWLRLPLVAIGHDPGHLRPLRINVVELAGDVEHAWVPRQPWPERLRLSSENPANLGWLLFR